MSPQSSDDSLQLGPPPFEVAQGMFELERFPEPEVNLRAWNAADSYLLEWLAQNREVGRGQTCVVNDSFGALALALASSGETVTSWSDSFIAHQGARANAIVNNIDVDLIDWAPSTRAPAPPEDERTFGLIVVRVPKSLDRLQDQLDTLAPFIGAETTVVAGGMTKQIHNSTIRCFERAIGATTTSLAHKKARLIFAQPGPDTGRSAEPTQPQFTTPGGLTILSDPALFSSGKLDPASALVLDPLTPLISSPDIRDVVDMGCGTGAIGLSLLQQEPTLAVTFTDESYLAVALSQQSLTLNLADSRIDSTVTTADKHQFVVDDCGSTIADQSQDLVVINPPFHDATAQTMNIAKRMFANAARVLRPGGVVVVVGNRHLKHHSTLRQWFDKPTIVASDRRFVALQARLGSRLAHGEVST